MGDQQRIETELATHPDLVRIADEGRRLIRGLTAVFGSEALAGQRTPEITVSTVFDVYHGWALSVTSGGVVLATDAGMVEVAMEDIVVVTP